MQDFTGKSLEDILDKDEFMAVQDELSNLLQFSVITVNTEGVPIGHWNNFTDFCHLIRSSEKGYANCIECDRVASLRAIRLGVPQSYICHCGLRDCAAPIIVEGQYLGSVLGGQVLTSEEERSKINVDLLSEQFNISKELLSATIAKLEVVSEDYLERCMKFYSFMASYLAEISIKKLTQESLAQETSENFKLLQLIKEQELKRMKAQMNPHFLFNALNSIARMALLEEAPKAEQLIYELSDYLKYTIKNVEEMPPIKLELDNLMHYIAIQNTRFGDRISFSVDIDPHILEYKIPSMILQPLVENAVVHGVELLKEGGKISVTGKKKSKDSDIYFSIIDNGVGFPNHILQLFNSNLDKNDNTLGLGLLNTHARIQHKFGSEYGLTIDSEPLVSNCVTIKIPCIT